MAKFRILYKSTQNGKRLNEIEGKTVSIEFNCHHFTKYYIGSRACFLFVIDSLKTKTKSTLNSVFNYDFP